MIAWLIVFLGGVAIGYVCGVYRGTGYVTWIAGVVSGYAWGRYRVDCLKGDTEGGTDG